MGEEEIEIEMKEIMRMKRANLEWQNEYMRRHFPFLTGDSYEDEDE